MSAPVVTLSEFVEEILPKLDCEVLAITSGAWDLIMIGHMKFFVASKQRLNEIYPNHVYCVIVDSREYVIQKNGYEFTCQKDRGYMVSAIKGVDYVILNDAHTFNVVNAIEMIFSRTSIKGKFMKGGDRKGLESIPEWWVCLQYGIEIITGMGGKKTDGSANKLSRVASWYEWFKRKIRNSYGRDYWYESSSKWEVIPVGILLRNYVIDGWCHWLGIAESEEDEFERYDFLDSAIERADMSVLPMFLDAMFVNKGMKSLFYKILNRMGMLVNRCDFDEILKEEKIKY